MNSLPFKYMWINFDELIICFGRMVDQPLALCVTSKVFPVQNVSSGFTGLSCTVVLTTTPLCYFLLNNSVLWEMFFGLWFLTKIFVFVLTNLTIFVKKNNSQYASYSIYLRGSLHGIFQCWNLHLGQYSLDWVCSLH